MTPTTVVHAGDMAEILSLRPRTTVHHVILGPEGSGPPPCYVTQLSVVLAGNMAEILSLRPRTTRGRTTAPGRQFTMSSWARRAQDPRLATSRSGPPGVLRPRHDRTTALGPSDGRDGGRMRSCGERTVLKHDRTTALGVHGDRNEGRMRSYDRRPGGRRHRRVPGIRRTSGGIGGHRGPRCTSGGSAGMTGMESQRAAPGRHSVDVPTPGPVPAQG